MIKHKICHTRHTVGIMVMTLAESLPVIFQDVQRSGSIFSVLDSSANTGGSGTVLTHTRILKYDLRVHVTVLYTINIKFHTPLILIKEKTKPKLMTIQWNYSRK